MTTQPFYAKGFCPNCKVQEFNPISLGKEIGKTDTHTVYEVDPPFTCNNCKAFIAEFYIDTDLVAQLEAA